MWSQFREWIRSKRNKPFSFLVNCIGMTLAFTAIIILYTYVHAELNHDENVKNRANIVRVKTADWGITPGAYGGWLAGSFPEIKEYCRMMMMGIALYIPPQQGVEELYTEEPVVLGDSCYPRFFSLQILQGEPNGIATTDQVMVSEKMARKLFGDANPIGKQLVMGGQFHCTVSAVFKDIVNPALRKPEILVNLHYVDKNWQEGYSDSWRSANWETFLELLPGTDREALLGKFRKLYTRKMESFGYEPENIKENLPYLQLQDYKELYFTPAVDFSTHGNRSNINILILIAILVLIVSIINYVNMATARLADKTRVIGVKRTLGANRGMLIGSIVMDSVFTCFLAMFGAWIVALLVFPSLSQWLGYGFNLEIDIWNGMILLAGIPLLCGVLSGLHPAFYLTRMNRLDSLNSQRNESIALQRVKGSLMILQFAVSMGLIISTLLIFKQVNFMKQRNPGYNPKNVVMVNGHGESVLMKKFPEFRELLLQNPAIVNATAAKSRIYDINERGSYLKIPGLDENMGGHIIWVDEYFMDVMELQLVEGEAYREGGNNKGRFLMNQQMAKEIASKSPDHTYLTEQQTGVVKDFNFKSMHQKITPLCFGYLNDFQGMADVYIRIVPEKRQEALAYIEKCYKELYPQTFYQYSFMENDYTQLYGDEDLFARRLLIFTGLSIVIACLGLLAFVVFFIEQKTKSIGVRKVMGATEMQMLVLLNKDFIKRLLIAFILICPIVYYVIQIWLDNFAYKTELSWWIFALAFVIMVVIALLCVSALTWRAATANPVNALKSE